MSPYADELAHARLEALRQLIDAMRAAEDPAEKRRCAVAIFNAPDPCDLDDEIELEDDEDDDGNDTDDSNNQRAPSVSERVESPAQSTSPITPNPPSSVPSVPPAASQSSPLATPANDGSQTRQHPEDEDSDDTLVVDDPDDPRLGLTDEQIIAKGAAILKALHRSVHSP